MYSQRCTRHKHKMPIQILQIQRKHDNMIFAEKVLKTKYFCTKYFCSGQNAINKNDRETFKEWVVHRNF